MNTVKYDDMRLQLPNFSQGMSRGTGIVSQLIMQGESLGEFLSFHGWKWCNYSHVWSVIYYTPAEVDEWLHLPTTLNTDWVKKLHMDTGVVAVIESTVERVKGVQINLMSDVIKRSGWHYIRPLLESPPETDKLWIKDGNFISSTLGLPYEQSPLEFIGAGVHWVHTGQGDATSYFCSEYNAARLQSVNLLPLSPYASKYSPMDWADGGPLEKNLTGCKIGPVMKLVA